MKSRITVDYIRLIHRYAISVKRGEESLRDAVRYEPDLDFLCMKLEMKSDPFERSATALYEVAYNHPFVEGNKRTALILCENLLEGDLYIAAKELDICDHVMQVARGERTIDEIVVWLKANTSSSE